ELFPRPPLDEPHERLLDVVEPRPARHVERLRPRLRARRSCAGQRDDVETVAVAVALDEGAVKLSAVNARVRDEEQRDSAATHFLDVYVIAGDRAPRLRQP